MNMNNWAVSREVHSAAHDLAHKEATKVARKVKKAVRYIGGIDQKAISEAAYRSAYEPAYRDQLLLELVSLFRRELKRCGEQPATDLARDLAFDASREHLRQMFGLDRGSNERPPRHHHERR